MIPLPCPVADPALEPERALKFPAPRGAMERAPTLDTCGTGCPATRVKGQEDSAPGPEGEFQAVLRTLSEEVPPPSEGAIGAETGPDTAQAGEAETDSTTASCVAVVCWLQASLGLPWPSGSLPGVLPPGEAEGPASPTATGSTTQPGQVALPPLVPLAQPAAGSEALQAGQAWSATAAGTPAPPAPTDPAKAFEVSEPAAAPGASPEAAAAGARPAPPAGGPIPTPFAGGGIAPMAGEVPPAPQADASRPARTVEASRAGAPIESQQETGRPGLPPGEPPPAGQVPEVRATLPASSPVAAPPTAPHAMAAEGAEELRSAASVPRTLRRPGPAAAVSPDQVPGPDAIRSAQPLGPDPAAGMVQPAATAQNAGGAAARDTAGDPDRRTPAADPARTPAAPVAHEPVAPAEVSNPAERPEAAAGRPVLTPAGLQRVVSAARMSAAGGGMAVRLTLHPESLGEVVVQVRWDRGALTAQLEAATPAARAALEGGLDRLRTALAEQGVPVERLQVGLQLGPEAHSQRDAPAERQTEAPAARQAEALRPGQAPPHGVGDGRRLDVRV